MKRVAQFTPTWKVPMPPRVDRAAASGSCLEPVLDQEVGHAGEVANVAGDEG
jgi:hypothetical protein